MSQLDATRKRFEAHLTKALQRFEKEVAPTLLPGSGKAVKVREFWAEVIRDLPDEFRQFAQELPDFSKRLTGQAESFAALQEYLSAGGKAIFELGDSPALKGLTAARERIAQKVDALDLAPHAKADLKAALEGIFVRARRPQQGMRELHGFTINDGRPKEKDVALRALVSELVEQGAIPKGEVTHLTSDDVFRLKMEGRQALEDLLDRAHGGVLAIHLLSDNKGMDRTRQDKNLGPDGVYATLTPLVEACRGKTAVVLLGDHDSLYEAKTLAPGLERRMHTLIDLA